MAGLQTMLRGLAVAALTFAACAPAHAETLTGTASVVDGDTLESMGRGSACSVSMPRKAASCAPGRAVNAGAADSRQHWRSQTGSADRPSVAVAAILTAMDGWSPSAAAAGSISMAGWCRKAGPWRIAVIRRTMSRLKTGQPRRGAISGPAASIGRGSGGRHDVSVDESSQQCS